jgi:hypothetical protein
MLSKGILFMYERKDIDLIRDKREYRTDYLLTWNCKHIVNAFIRNLIEDICHKMDILIQ